MVKHNLKNQRWQQFKYGGSNFGAFCHPGVVLNFLYKPNIVLKNRNILFCQQPSGPGPWEVISVFKATIQIQHSTYY
jgi:hypothetical protein